mgnify:CR=1 FL=1
MPIKEIENIDFIAEENTFMKFIHREHNIFEKDNIKRERQTYIEITSVINKNQFKRVKSGSTSRESKKTRVLTEVFNNQLNLSSKYVSNPAVHGLCVIDYCLLYCVFCFILKCN